ncbi:MAG: outer membrane protein transport protein [Candidatus Symbiothrix sp.]|jgi:hypothetical protein|nr:outer membrane protein transport protein [Candidatus Symbiothrix sp.]
MKQAHSTNTPFSLAWTGRSKGFSFLLIAVFLSAFSYAQSEIDAFRISGSDLTGTARGQAMGGAFGSLGGDITGVTINPAGIGIYRASELSATLGLNSINIKTQGAASANDKNKLKFNLDNISYVGYFPIGDDYLQSVNFGFSYNKEKDFNRNYSAGGNALPVSLTDYIAYRTNGIPKREIDYDDAFRGNAPWLGILGWQGGLIDNLANSEDQYGSVLAKDEKVNTQLIVSEKGYTDNYNFTLGTNFSNSLYLGFTLSLTDIYYRMDALQREDADGSKYLSLSNYLQTEGSGYQVKVGAIWRPLDFLRLGVAYHSPTWYTLKDFYQGRITANLSGNYSCSTPEDNAGLDYRFTAPYSWTFSAAGILGAKAVVSVDYELKDYGSMTFSDQYSSISDNFEGQNKDISMDFKMASTLRAGLEYRFTSQLSGRLGYALKEHPYEAKIKNREIEVVTAGTIPHYTIEGAINYFTAGLGYRFTPNFYMDAAFVYRTQKDDLYSYSSIWDRNGKFLVDSRPVRLTNTSYKGLVSLGYKF